MVKGVAGRVRLRAKETDRAREGDRERCTIHPENTEFMLEYVLCTLHSYDFQLSE